MKIWGLLIEPLEWFLVTNQYTLWQTRSPHLVDDYDFPDFDSFFSRQKMRFRSPWFKPSPKRKNLELESFFVGFFLLGLVFWVRSFSNSVGLFWLFLSVWLLFFDWRKVWVVGWFKHSRIGLLEKETILELKDDLLVDWILFSVWRSSRTIFWNGYVHEDESLCA